MVKAALIPFGDISEVQIPLDYQTGRLSSLRTCGSILFSWFAFLWVKTWICSKLRQTSRVCFRGVRAGRGCGGRHRQHERVRAMRSDTQGQPGKTPQDHTKQVRRSLSFVFAFLCLFTIDCPEVHAAWRCWAGLATNSIQFCWLFTIEDWCKWVRFLQTHYQGLRQLLMTVSRDLRA